MININNNIARETNRTTIITEGFSAATERSLGTDI